MADVIQAYMIGFLGIIAGLLYVRNSARRLTDMDYRKRTIRALKGSAYLIIGAIYFGIATGWVETPNPTSALIVRMMLIIVFSLSAAYAYIER